MIKNNLKTVFGVILLLIIFTGCKKTSYTLGDLTSPANIVVTTVLKGVDATHPNGDGSGDVTITVKADNALSYKVDYDANTAVDLVFLPTGSITKKYTSAVPGVYTFRITAVAYGKGGTSSTTTKDVTVRLDYTPDPTIVANLTGGSSKTWNVDKSVPGHMGVGPWSGSAGPDWWAAAPNEKVACCNCFYTASFTFTKVVANNTFTLQAATPNGAFTKTGALTTLPGIPGSGDEGCYTYAGGTTNFSFSPSVTGIPLTSSTQTSILLAGNTTFIGYGATQKEYEILQITPTYLYLRVQGTETGNAWYLKLKAP